MSHPTKFELTEHVKMKRIKAFPNVTTNHTHSCMSYRAAMFILIVEVELMHSSLINYVQYMSIGEDI